jgi:hypothetical protein
MSFDQRTIENSCLYIDDIQGIFSYLLDGMGGYVICCMADYCPDSIEDAP